MVLRDLILQRLFYELVEVAKVSNFSVTGSWLFHLLVRETGYLAKARKGSYLMDYWKVDVKKK